MSRRTGGGVRDILILCADGLTEIKEAISAVLPKTEYQRCIVHQVRNTLKYVPEKDRKAFATDLKTIYQALDEKRSLASLEHVTEKWTPTYPNSMWWLRCFSRSECCALDFQGAMLRRKSYKPPMRKLSTIGKFQMNEDRADTADR